MKDEKWDIRKITAYYSVEAKRAASSDNCSTRKRLLASDGTMRQGRASLHIWRWTIGGGRPRIQAWGPASDDTDTELPIPESGKPGADASIIAAGADIAWGGGSLFRSGNGHYSRLCRLSGSLFWQPQEYVSKGVVARNSQGHAGVDGSVSSVYPRRRHMPVDRDISPAKEFHHNGAELRLPSPFSRGIWKGGCHFLGSCWCIPTVVCNV